ncbi:hypothetical protein OHT76_43535 [Streptomyces sp. NBC_00287]|uniref:hypothetical protein n=1 Tax=Streptomyces sp. NBC_00287 TaxID=2975702 RepID=UPI002E2CBA02|nr:hypothetical protein [Streptomyces sp. NBC_00287]
MIRVAAFACIMGLVSAGNGTASALAETSAGASAQIVASPAPTVSLPDPDQLQSALLKADELGPAFIQRPTASPSPSRPENREKDPRFEGCKPLAQLLNGEEEKGDSYSEHPQAVAAFASRDGQASVFEALTAGPPSALDAAYAQAKHALESCDAISLVSAGQTIKFSLTPIRFGGPDSSAVRMDARHHGVLVNGYIAIEQLIWRAWVSRDVRCPARHSGAGPGLRVVGPVGEGV